jgi:LCP family protein required for cell wall assembly
LGKSGVGHDAPDLTDTIIFSSISHKKNDLVLLSLPRDIWVPEIRAKLNSAYFWGNQKENGGGLILSKAVAEKIVGRPIHYAVVVDFSGFKDLIDTLGGVNVMVENSFVDEKFPISGKENDECGGDLEYKCRYETVKFESGGQIMDGETALKFARSRNAEGDEGTDLARAKRQQKIIEAIKNKLLSWEVISSPKKLTDALAVLRENTETDIPDSAGAVLARRIFQTRDQMVSLSIPDGFLLNPPISGKYDNLYVFIPAAETWKEFNKWVEDLLN